MTLRVITNLEIGYILLVESLKIMDVKE